MLDKVKDIFSDYSNKQENINEADFLKANLYKKSNRLEVCLTSKLQISIDEISNFEDYIIDRFKVGSARIEIKYEDIDIEPTIEKDWKLLHLLLHSPSAQPSFAFAFLLVLLFVLLFLQLLF